VREILGVIPARGGSKGIPRKNLAPLGGRPLIAYTCDAARGSRTLTRVVASTDDEEVAAVARRLGIEVPFLRPSALAADETPMLDVLLHLVSALARDGYCPEAIVLLQPTSPLRQAAHIDAAVDLLLESGADSVVSVVAVPHQFTPASLLRLEGDRVVPFGETPGLPERLGGVPPGPLRRQDKTAWFARNGPAVLAVRTAVLTGQRTLYGAETRALIMAREDSVDIDDGFDLEVAELLLAARTAGRSLA
jgi:CMP-N-acetylneuraminic acid synthetase